MRARGGEESIAALCLREGIAESLYYNWSKEFLKAGKKRLAGDTARAGAGCDAQYLFATDVLGSHQGHYPRHAKRYRDFKSEYARLQDERIAAFREYAKDVRSGAFPESRHKVTMDAAELDAFLREID